MCKGALQHTRTKANDDCRCLSCRLLNPVVCAEAYGVSGTPATAHLALSLRCNASGLSQSRATATASEATVGLCTHPAALATDGRDPRCPQTITPLVTNHFVSCAVRGHTQKSKAVTGWHRLRLSVDAWVTPTLWHMVALVESPPPRISMAHTVGSPNHRINGESGQDDGEHTLNFKP